MTAAPKKNATPGEAGAAFSNQTKARKSATHFTPTADDALEILYEMRDLLRQVTSIIDRQMAAVGQVVAR